jgi:hypothetical protein
MPPAEELARRLREADAEELSRLVEEHLEELGAAEVRQLLRNPFVTGEILTRLITRRSLLSFYEVRRDLARHPKTPEVLALRFIPGLYWRDLMEVGLDVKVRPVVRRAAENRLCERLPSLAVGERMMIARRGGPRPLTQLRNDPSRRVIAALLENPRLTEGTLSPLVRSETARPEVLAQVADDRRWGVRYSVRVGLSRNPQTPVETGLKILPHLKKRDLAAVAAAVRLPAPVRRRARVLLGEAK